MPTPQLSPGAAAKAAAVILLSAATDLAPSAAGASAASAPLGSALLYPAGAGACVAAAALHALASPAVLAGSSSAASILISVAPFAVPIAPTANAGSAASASVQAPSSLSLIARSVSEALAPVDAGSPASAYTFDAIAILDSSSRQVAQIARGLGPLETGHVNDLGDWIAAEDPVALIVEGFGISAAGVPYYDTQAVDAGEQAQLLVDPVNRVLWLSR